MLIFLTSLLYGIAAMLLGAIATLLPILLLFALIWLITRPFERFFK